MFQAVSGTRQKIFMAIVADGVTKLSLNTDKKRGRKNWNGLGNCYLNNAPSERLLLIDRSRAVLQRISHCNTTP